MRAHEQVATRAQRHQRFRGDDCPWQKPQLIARQDRRQDQLRFIKCKLVAKTQAWATSKGKVGKAMASCRTLLGEAFGIERVWPLPKSWMTMRDVGEDQNVRPCGNRVATDLIVAQSTTAQTPGRGIEAHGLLNHHTSQGELRKILEHRRAPV